MNLYRQVGSGNKVLFVNGMSDGQREALEAYTALSGKTLQPIVLLSHKRSSNDWLQSVPGVIILSVDFSDSMQLQKVLKPYIDDIVVATCVGDGNVPYLKAVVPFLPCCTLPTETSLEWTTEKIKMRSLLRGYDASIAPKFMVARDDTEETIARIEKQVGYPLVVKPSGLAASLLVSICYHREELEQVLKHTMKRLHQVYKLKQGRGDPSVLVEEFMEGDMYSIDAYVNARGVIYFTPLVYVKTGREVGFDDFFGYMRMTPTQLNGPHTEEAQSAAVKAVRALCMRSTTCHIELLRTEKGWKVIELGPRMGGFRHEMYRLSFGIDHALNDILVRMSQKPRVSKKTKGYTAVLQFYARQEGTLQKIEGLPKVEALASLQHLRVRKQPGDECTFAKHGGDPVLEVTMFDPIRSNLLADIRRIEQQLNIVTSR